MQGKLSAEVCEVGLLLKILNISPPGPSRGLGIAGLELGRKEEDVNLLLTSPHRQWEDQRPWGQRASGLNPGSTTFCLCDLLNPVSLSFPTCHQAPCGGPSLQNTRSEIKPGPWAAPCCSSPAWPCLARPSLLWELPSLRWGHRTPPGSCEELKWQDKWDILSHAGFEDTSGILGLETSSNPAEMVAVELAGGQNKESLECPGTWSLVPWGDIGAISLISSLDRFLPHSSLGLGRLPALAAASTTPSVSVPVLAARAMQLGAGGLPGVGGGSSPSLSAVGPGHASNRLLANPFQLLFFTNSFARDPLIPRP
ncbi:uncharacterized protein LOC116657454 isoform X1 [Camelus ferus]|uniref:Uncharacterized protein LOC116657454 isoform X1 n=1 Tax=Camelus ferus TaxID=419612 RepID=A0A8B8RBS2_CAMFR|nr:uncharacterized protein LOC116657454 isoform X1 [Camelus ferus]